MNIVVGKIKKDISTLQEKYLKNRIGGILILTNIMYFTYLLMKMIK